ncbi:substrate-binding periplasmic protein [Clostridium cibarium]|uniref:Amino acid ABC transporter substrate-binding protein n=1 Tax=Clostridium cibarium TaxID=2762247 RepID=A0ABR8PXJ7_9CLOT|nr:transporter substrate-binding domain-containing protein [Clostridium cibarium]MBD7912869.1 amino acid ABC transporter substrate-binding protein [Clostridium cibarium]
MKSYFKCIVSLIIILCFSVCVRGEVIKAKNENVASGQQTDRLQKIKKKGVLTVVATNNKPYSYKDPKTGEFVGVDADILKEVARRIGINKVDVKYTLFSNALEELIKNPDIDLFAEGIYATEERKALVNFTIPIYYENEVVLTRKDSNINSKEDLKNSTVGVLAGTVYVKLVEGWKNQGIIKDYRVYPDNNSLTMALENKTLDAILTDSLIAENIILLKPKSKFKLLSPSQYKSEINIDIGYPIKKEDVTLLNAINEKLQEMKEDGTLFEILAKYGLIAHYVP